MSSVRELLKIICIRISMHFPQNGRFTRFSDLINDSRTRPPIPVISKVSTQKVCTASSAYIYKISHSTGL